jgi:hypothetical protein
VQSTIEKLFRIDIQQESIVEHVSDVCLEDALQSSEVVDDKNNIDLTQGQSKEVATRAHAKVIDRCGRRARVIV